MEFENSGKIRGIVDEIKEVWSKDSTTISEIRLKCGTSEKREYYAIVNTFEHLDEIQGMGLGAVLEVTGFADATQGKDGRWWGKISTKKINLVSPAPSKVVKSAPTQKELDDEFTF